MPDFDPFVLDPGAEGSGASATDDLGSLSIDDLGQNGISPERPLPLTMHEIRPSVDDLQPSMVFEEDAAFVQNATFEQELPPPIPMQTGCDWYLPSPELGTSLLAEFLTDMNAACPLYQPHIIANHLRVCYAGESDGTSVSWISAYVVFGIAHM